MEIKLNSDLGSVARTTSQTPKPKAVTAPSEENVFFGQSQALNETLTGLPDIRVSKVERARSLALTETYPPAEIQHKIARLLAVKQEQTESTQ